MRLRNDRGAAIRETGASSAATSRYQGMRSRTHFSLVVSALSGAAALTGALVLPPVAAAAPAASSGSSVASSSGAGLELTVPGHTLALGSSTTSAAANGWLFATGAGVLAPSSSGEASASAPPGSSKTEPRTCGGNLPAFPAPMSGLAAASLACGSAGVHNFSPMQGVAKATGQAASFRLDLSSILSQVVQPASPAVNALEGVLGKLPPLPAGGTTVGRIFQQVDKAATSDFAIEIAPGPSSSTTSITAAGWSTTATAAGVVITILPTGGIGGAPLAKIVVGSASATASVHRASARAGGSGGALERPAATDNPALVSVEVNAPGVGSRNFSVVPGQSMTILKGTPLQSTISVGSGSVTTAPSGAVTAQASAVTIALAQGVGASPATADNGGIQLSLANATATAAAQKAAVTPAPHTTPPSLVSNPVPNATTPHTGLPWAGAAPLLAAGALGGSTLLLWPRLRRRSSLRLRPHSRPTPPVDHR
jgi:hypothetical protein